MRLARIVVCWFTGTCPHCGVLVYRDLLPGRPMPDELKAQLAELGVVAEMDAQGEVTRVQLIGDRYNDHTIHQLARLKGIPVIDVSGTEISQRGVDILRRLLPDAIVEFYVVFVFLNLITGMG